MWVRVCLDMWNIHILWLCTIFLYSKHMQASLHGVFTGTSHAYLHLVRRAGACSCTFPVLFESFQVFIENKIKAGSIIKSLSSCFLQHECCVNNDQTGATQGGCCMQFCCCHIRHWGPHAQAGKSKWGLMGIKVQQIYYTPTPTKFLLLVIYRVHPTWIDLWIWLFMDYLDHFS